MASVELCEGASVTWTTTGNESFRNRAPPQRSAVGVMASSSVHPVGLPVQYVPSLAMVAYFVCVSLVTVSAPAICQSDS